MEGEALNGPPEFVDQSAEVIYNESNNEPTPSRTPTIAKNSSKNDFTVTKEKGGGIGEVQAALNRPLESLRQSAKVVNNDLQKEPI